MTRAQALRIINAVRQQPFPGYSRAQYKAALLRLAFGLAHVRSPWQSDLVDDATIRSAMRELGTAMFGTPPDHLSVPYDVRPHGLDVQEVTSWVERNGGHISRAENRRTGLGPGYGTVQVTQRFEIPLSVLIGPLPDPTG